MDSTHPRGKIRKEVWFQHVPELSRNVYNLAFGDFDERTGGMDDRVVSNNGDRQLILHTIGNAIADFLSDMPHAILLIRGSSRSRIRLYQIGIAFFWNEIKSRYEILGKYQNDWVPFERNVNYEEFVVFKKIS